MSQAQFSYAPGTATGICGPSLAALVAIAPNAALVRRLADVAATSGDVEDLLDVLVSGGLRAVSDFAVVARAGGGNRVFVRGGYRVEVAGQPALAGSGLWAEAEFPATTDLTLSTGAATIEPSLPLGAGVVLAERIRLTATGAVGAPAEPTASPVPTPTPGPTATPVPTPTPGPVAAAAAAAPQAPVVAEPAHLHPAQGEPTPAEQGFDHLFGPTSALVEVPPPAEQVAPVAPAAAEPADIGMTLEAAATGVPPEVPEREPGEAPGFIDAVPRSFRPAPPKDQPAAPGLIDSLPWEDSNWRPPAQPATAPPPVHPAPPVRPAPPRLPAADPMTVDRRQLAESAATGPIVVAARCTNGHLSPAHAGVCRVCHQPLPSQPPFEIPRPPLGVLRLSSGETITLDRGVIMGRNPRLPSDYSGEQPHLVQLNDPNRDVSGVHLEVRLDQWNVLVRDLGSTNGTEVHLPGRGPIALRPHDPVAIEPGTKVVLAGVLDFVFEVAG